MGEADFDWLGAEAFELLYGSVYRAPHFRIDAIDEILLRQSDLHSFDIFTQGSGEIGHGLVERSRVHFVVSRDCVEQHR